MNSNAPASRLCTSRHLGNHFSARACLAAKMQTRTQAGKHVHGRLPPHSAPPLPHDACNMDQNPDKVDNDNKIYMGDRYGKCWIRRNPEDTLSLHGVITLCPPATVLKLSPAGLARFPHTLSDSAVQSKKRKRMCADIGHDLSKRLFDLVRPWPAVVSCSAHMY